MNRKLRKLRKLLLHPKMFFVDAKYNRLMKKNNEQQQDVVVSAVGNESSDVKKSISSIQITQPMNIGAMSFLNNVLKIELHKKKVINQSLGFSTLVLSDVNNKYLINKPYLGVLIRDKSFIGFKDKSIYVLDIGTSLNYKELSKYKVNKLFLETEFLRQKKFKEFRNVLDINPRTPAAILIKKSDPKIRFVCVITNKTSLEYMKIYCDEIDVLIVYKNLDYSKFDEVPRIIEMSSKSSFLGAVKMALIDNSYKSDCNLLLPILTATCNLPNIDKLNDSKHITGLIRLSYSLVGGLSFNDLILAETTVIKELYLRDNLYSIYKDKIFKAGNEQEKLKKLLLLTLKEGVFYEKI